MSRYFFFAFLLIGVVSGSVQASTLFGRVVEINGGDVITVFNLNRPVRIKLLAVDAPEEDQAFGDVAKKHLSDLVYDKSVLVEYWGIAADSSLVGRVMLNKTDVGAQMIRDGAAWFDESNQGRLSNADREIYQQSELAARNERRGLWQADAPVAPWEFVRARALRREPVASLNSGLPAARARANRPTPELTNLSLIGSSPASPAASNTAASDADAESILWAFEDSGPKHWKTYSPEGHNFSVDVPDDGARKQIVVPFHEQMFDVNVYAARDTQAIYALMWITGPSVGLEGQFSLKEAVRGFLYGFSEGYRRRNNERFVCEPKGERRIPPADGFSGSEFDIPSCTIPAKVRIYSRFIGSERQLYIAAVFYADPDDAKVSRFMKSFTITTSQLEDATPKH
jgi:endonuclease YncB( thermonuclease family)